MCASIAASVHHRAQTGDLLVGTSLWSLSLGLCDILAALRAKLATPFSDVNVATMSLQEALQSGILKTIRQQHGSLTETAGGCALWTEREWVRSLLPLSKSITMKVSPSSEHESKS